MSNQDVRIPRYPECWETCGNCGQGQITVAEVLVKPGDEVRAGDTLLTLETGKVALDIAALHTGTVSAVLVREGDAVSEGQTVVTLCPKQ